MKRFSILLFLCLLGFLPSEAQKKKNSPSKAPTFNPADRPKNLSDDELLELVQKQTFRYFWDLGHPVSGLALERSNVAFDYGGEVTTIGGTGFGIMAMVVAAERQWHPRDSVANRLLKMVRFLSKADHYHGIFPHWLNGATGKTIPFGRKDDGGDLVESSFLFQGLLTAKEYFDGKNPVETELRNRISGLWNDAEWDWYTQGSKNQLYWHWSPNHGWAMNFELRGYNETLITHILAASAPRYPVTAEVYHKCWAQSDHFSNGKEYYGIELPLGYPAGGPLFFAHYSFLGLDPRGLSDRYADYWKQNVNHTRINHAHCVANPGKFKGYSEKSWGLTASDTYNGYNAHSPTNDFGTITPTAALSSFPYTPAESMKALRYFYEEKGDELWSEYGFVDAFNETQNWYADSHLAIDQGPIIVMIENYRTGLLWDLFMKNPDVQRGVKKLGFESNPKK